MRLTSTTFRHCTQFFSVGVFRLLFAIAGLILVSLPASAAVLGVPAQYPTIQAAINASSSGDTVLLAAGIYSGPGNVDLDFGGKNLTVESLYGASASAVIIDCGGSSATNHRAFYLHSGETNAVISGLTILNGFEGQATGFAGAGGAILSSSVGLIVSNCIIQNNEALGGAGGGIYNDNPSLTSNSVLIINCMFLGNSAGSGGGTLFNNSTSGSKTTVTNCTFLNNTQTYTDVVDNYSNSTGVMTLTNDILYGAATEIGGGNITASYCDVQGGYVGTGNINADPLFVNPPADLRLLAGSPCIGAGTAVGAPGYDLVGATRPRPPSIGAFEKDPRSPTTVALTSTPNPSVAGKPVTFTATVKASAGTPTGTVTFSITDTRPGGGTLQTPVTLSAGTAAYTTTFLAATQFLISASYAGDATNGTSMSTPLTQTVNATTSATSLTSSLNPSSVNQALTFTATITGSNPSGSITLNDTTTGTVVGAGSFVRGGPVTFSVNSLGGGTHKITASYGGDGSNSPSVSPALTQTVKPVATTTTVSARVNPSIAGQSNLLTVNVSAGGSFVVVPTGTVTFTIDGTAQPPVMLSNGYYAAFDDSSLAAGSHMVTASYSGDASYVNSTSNALTQVVNAHISPQYVSPSGSDSNPGTQAAPKLTIQAAINATLSGDTVIVMDGMYTGPGDVDLTFGGKVLTVTSQNGASRTVIDCGGSANANHRGFTLSTNYGTNLSSDGGTISGFTIQNGYVYGYGGGIAISNASATVQNCIIKNNSAVYGGGLYNSASASSSIVIINCVVIGNTSYSYGQGGGMLNSVGGTISVINCTVTGNTATAGTNNAAPGGGIYNSNFSYGTITLSNDILYGDTGGELVSPNATPNYCDIQGGFAGNGNINADPLFVGASYGDFHLQPDSPCLGAGTAAGAPATTIDGRARPTPPSIGAYEVFVAPTAVAVANTSGTAGQPVTLSVTLSNPGGAAVSGRTLSFSIDGIAAGTAATNNAGAASLPYAIPANTTVGGHTISVSFAGDMTNGASSGIGTLTVAAAPAAVQINAGGGASGTFAADTGFSGGSTYATNAAIDTSSVTSPAPQAVYQTERYGNFTYTVPNLTPGTLYTLRLHFAEIYWQSAGQRLFNVTVNGATVLSNFDIFAAAGGGNRAVVETFLVTADSLGKVTLVFTTLRDNAKLSGLEILPAPAPQTTIAQINAGGGASGTFAADTGFSGGSTYATNAAIDTSSVTSPAPQAVYQTERYGNFTYTVPNLTPGTLYTLRLHFAEIYWQSAGQRLFNVTVNGATVLSNFDIFAATGGGNKAVVETFSVNADSNGKVTLVFTTVRDNAKLSGLELLQ